MIKSHKCAAQPSKSFNRLARVARSYRKINLRRNALHFVILLMPALALLCGVLLMAYRQEFGMILFMAMMFSALMLAVATLFFQACFTDKVMLLHLPCEYIQKELNNPFNDFTEDEKRYFHLWLERKPKPNQGNGNPHS